MYKDKNQRDFARHLRNNMTDVEWRLWNALRCEQLKGFKFRRQAAIGDFVVDFICFSGKLVIELDGGQHNETKNKNYDQERTAWLNSQGFQVLRFWNHDVFENLDGIVEVIWKSLQVPPSPTSPQLKVSQNPSPTLPIKGRE